MRDLWVKVILFLVSLLCIVAKHFIVLIVGDVTNVFGSARTYPKALKRTVSLLKQNPCKVRSTRTVHQSDNLGSDLVHMIGQENK